MTKTIEYAEYRRDLSRDASQPVPASLSPESVIGYAGLSAFNIPREVSFHLHDGRLAIEFHYSDEERGERYARTVPRMEGVELVLGRETKKIIQIRTSDVYRFLESNMGRLELLGVQEIAKGLPPRNGRILMRNAEVVSSILNELPRQVRSHVVRVAKQQRYHDR